jgi:hypothetical protein
MFREPRHGAAVGLRLRGYDRGYYEPYAGPGGGSVLPKVIGVIVAVGLIRMLVSHKRGRDGGSWRERRLEMIADMHRELHRQEDLKADASAPATGTTKA